MTDRNPPHPPPADAVPGHSSWHLLWAGVLSLAAWTRWLSPWWLLLSAGVCLAWILPLRAGRRLHALAALLLLFGSVLGFLASWNLDSWSPDGDTPSHFHESRVHEALNRRFDALLESGGRAVEEAFASLDEVDPSDLQETLSRIRRRHGVTALATYDGEGRPQAWVGVHRGPIPEVIRRAETAYAFGGKPLFRYLYFTARAREGGRTAVAAVLLQGNLPGGLEGGGFVSRFRRETGIPIQVFSPQRDPGQGGWDLEWEGESLLSISLMEGAGREGWAPRVRLWVRIMAMVILLAWGFLVVGGKGLPGFRQGAVTTLLLTAFLIPAHQVWAWAALSSPGHFQLPLPFDGSLGQILGLLGALVLLCGLFPVGRARWAGPVSSAAFLAVAYPLLEVVFRQAPAPSLLSGSVGSWLAYESALALLLSVVACLALGLGSGGDHKWAKPWLLPAGLVLALVLTLVGALQARAGPGLPLAFLALWGLPALLVAHGLGRRKKGRIALAWVSSALLGSTAALPAAWGIQIQARMTDAEVQLAELGAGVDPFLEFRLARMAETTDSLDAILEPSAEFLFDSWAQTGRQGDPIPMWLTAWSPSDLPFEDLAMGVSGPRPGEADDFLDEVREAGTPILRHLGLWEVRYILLVPLRGDWVLSAVVPSGGSLFRSSPMGPIFAMDASSGSGPPGLAPIPVGEEGGFGEEVRWEETEEGWRGRKYLSSREGGYLARQTVTLPGTRHMVARGTLALVLDLLLILALWGLGRGMARGREVDPRAALQFLGSFRARVTVALFAFFLLSIAIFGTLAFRTISLAAQRTASALAERLTEDAASLYFELQRSMALLSDRVGADFLEYRDGVLVGGSADELVDLGLYEGWVPEPIFRALVDQAEIKGTHRSSLGGWDYVMAYRRLPDGDILATPVPVEAGATALRRQEVADFLGFAIVLGGALSLALALLVGRTLTRPIEILQVASERVGSGNLRVRLPEVRSDEFGAVFGAFNRMVLGIRRARRALLRTTRRTQAIVEEAATGVVALDSSGRVTLANPRAEALLDEKILVGEPVPGREREARELVEWIDLYFRDGIREASTELQMGTRRIRIKARRVTAEGPLGGAVLSLEDVTDELRTERILAWGEMAQQVAHEVKNPLTPIKLSVQHLQRAWEDRRPDFNEILGKNVEVILREIEHLAAIARSFSRFGAPRAAGEVPLEPVSVHAVAEEVLNLYRGGEGALDFESAIPAGLAPVQSRESELREVLINLLENSRAAIPEEGTVVIEARVGSGSVELMVRDDGKGIPPELLPRIFEPHFSTRSAGTGLGLAIVRRLVESWGGTVTAESQEGRGSVVVLVIPYWKQGETREEGEGTWS